MNSKTLLGEFFRYTIPNVCGMIGLSCYIFADTLFVSRGLGADGLTALNLAIPIYSFVHGSGLMLGMGGATKYSILRGQKDDSSANRVFTNTIYLTAVSAIIFLFLGIFFPGSLTGFLGANRDVFDMTRTYIQFILLFAPAFMMNDMFLCFVRNDGAPRLAMTAMLIGSLSNIILDYIFIFPLQLGILGAVLATGFAPLISMGILAKHRILGRNHFHLVKSEISPKMTASILSLGIPSLIAEVASGIVMIVFNIIILRLRGNIGVAAYGVVANLSLVITSIYTGIAQGIQPVISGSYGCGDNSSAKKIFQYAIITMLFLSSCLYLTFWICANPIAELFNSERNIRLQQLAVIGLKLYFTAIPFVGFNIILSMYFTSTEKAVPAQAVSLTRGFLLILPMAFLLSFFAGMTGVWLSYPITEGLTALMGLILYQRLLKTA